MHHRNTPCLLRWGLAIAASVAPAMVGAQETGPPANTASSRTDTVQSATTSIAASSTDSWIDVCVVPGSGTVYRVGVQATPQTCVDPSHVAVRLNLQGPTGPAGPQGERGLQGETGPEGERGPQGEAGPQGERGLQGEVGHAGATGAPGPQGPAGATGAAGVQGPQGEAGPQGAQGNDGPAGAQGPQGEPGPTGPAGPTGAVGPAGPAGPEGPQGPTGPAGASGTSDHSLLTNLDADNHTQYLLADSVRTTVNGFAVIGTEGAGTIPTTGAGARLMWYPGMSAIRAGVVGSYGATYWDQSNIGRASAAFGENTRASGTYSFAAGLATTASGSESVALGNNGTASANRALAFNGTASGVGAVAIGSGAQATNDDAIALGPSSIAGGLASTVIGPSIANGSFGVAIGLQNSASGNYSVAIGKNARTSNRQGSIVLGDGCAGFSSDSVYPTANNQFVARGCGGIRFFTSQNLSSGVEVIAGGGSWNSISDRNRKENFQAVDGDDILARLRLVPVSSWNYIAQGQEIRHIGPMAQDWEAAFGLSGDSTTINTGDMDGVTLAGVQALDARTTRQAERIESLEQHNRELEAANAALEARLRALERRLEDLVARPADPRN